jgi:hypothetical protein
MRADLKFLMQFYGLSGKSEFGGLGRLRHATVQRGQVLLLRGGEVAKFTFGGFLAGDIASNFGAKCVGGGEVIGGQSRGHGGRGDTGGNDESALVREDGGRHVWSVHGSQFLVNFGLKSV